MASESKEYSKALSRWNKEDWFVGLTSVSLFLFATAISENFNLIYREYFLPGFFLAIVFVILATLLHRLVTIERRAEEASRQLAEEKEKNDLKLEIKAIKDGIEEIRTWQVSSILQEIKRQHDEASEHRKIRHSLVSEIVSRYNEGVFNALQATLDNRNSTSDWDSSNKEIWRLLIISIGELKSRYLTAEEKNPKHIVSVTIEKLEEMSSAPTDWRSLHEHVARIREIENPFPPQALLTYRA